jgi:transposase/predicted nuclease of predicted toxin-antitoxin system
LTAPRFLIDENLSVQLPPVAHTRVFAAAHVVHLGLGKWKDWNILNLVKNDGWVLVPNNAVEFRSRYRAIEVHPGVMFLLPSARREQQIVLFEAALNEVAIDLDLTNRAWFGIPRLVENSEKFLALRRLVDSDGAMMRGGFLNAEDREQLIALARDGATPSRVTRRANAVALLDAGWSCQEVAAALFVNDDTIRDWHKLFEQRGIEGLTSFEVGGSASFLSTAQEAAVKAFVSTTLPRSTREVGAFIERQFAITYESRSGLIALLHRLGLEYHKPTAIARKLDEDKQRAFIASYDKLLNSLGNDEAVLFADAVHPTHAARPVGCWAPKQDKLAIEQTSGRQRLNIHGAINLESGQTRMIEVETVDAASTIKLLAAIEALYPLLVLIHVFLDNASYHHGKLVQEWLARPGCRIKLHFIPSYCPHLNPIERLWGLMHRNVTHNKCYATCADFADAALGFLREKVPKNWPSFCDSVTDNFRVIKPKDFRVLT